MSVDRGEHTETATRAGEAESVEAAARVIYESWWEDSEPDESARWEILEPDDDDRLTALRYAALAYPIIAAAVRAEEREQIAQRIEEKGERFTATTMTGRARRSGYHDAARLARGSS